MNINLSRFSNEELESLIKKAKEELMNRDSHVRISFKPLYEDLFLQVNKEIFQDDKYNLISWSGKNSRFGISLSEIIKKSGPHTLYAINPRHRILLERVFKYNEKIKDFNFIIQGIPCMKKEEVKYTSSLSGYFVFDIKPSFPRWIDEEDLLPDEIEYYKNRSYERKQRILNRFLNNIIKDSDDQETRILLSLLKFEKL